MVVGDKSSKYITRSVVRKVSDVFLKNSRDPIRYRFPLRREDVAKHDYLNSIVILFLTICKHFLSICTIVGPVLGCGYKCNLFYLPFRIFHFGCLHVTFT